MSLIENLDRIIECKNNIKEALKNKGIITDGDKFEAYAGKINDFQFESGDTPSTPSADYIYSNGYLTNGTEVTDIVTYVPYEISLDDEGKFIIELTCPEEISSYEGSSYFDIIFTVDIPDTYTLIAFEFFEASSNAYISQPYKENPRHTTTVRNGVTYNSYVRRVEDDRDIQSEYIAYEPLQYRITIEKK